MTLNDPVFDFRKPLDTLKAFDRVCLAGFFHELKSYGISGQIFGLVS